MTRSEIVRFLVLRSIGNFLVLFALYGFLATFGPVIFFEIEYRIAQSRGIEYTVQDAKTSELGQLMQRQRGKTANQQGPTALGQILAGPKEQIMIPVDSEFGIVIPKIGANARIIPNVDPSNETVFLQALQIGVAHAQGTVFPGQNGNIYLFAHSTDNWWNVGRYNAIFYLLKELTIGDKVVLFFQNKRYNYVIVDTKIVDPTEVSYLTDAQKSTEQKLIMQTCWPPGTTWKRLLVFAKPK